jgi:hypothetical protein
MIDNTCIIELNLQQTRLYLLADPKLNWPTFSAVKLSLGTGGIMSFEPCVSGFEI